MVLNIEETVERARNGDKEALLNLIMDRKSEYYKLAYVYTGNKEDALDAMEDMIVILYQQINNLKNNDLFYSWSKTILINCSKKIFKNSKKILPIEEIKEEGYEEDFQQRDHSMDIMERNQGFSKGLKNLRSTLEVIIGEGRGTAKYKKA